MSSDKVEIRPAKLAEKKMIYEWLCESDFTKEILGPPNFPEHPIPTWHEFDSDYSDEIYFDDKSPRRGRSFVILLNKLPVGHINYNDIDELTSSVELDIWLASTKYVGKGIGSKAIQILCKELTEKEKIKYVLVQPSMRNQRAIAAYKKAGFHPFDLTSEKSFQEIYSSEYSDSFWMIKSNSTPFT